MRAAVRRIIGVAAAVGWLAGRALAADGVVVAEGERFKPLDDKGWRLTPQDQSYASHTYGGMWVTHGALISAPADSDGAVAAQTVTVPGAGSYRVWSKYQSPPYFNYLHKIEIRQKGKTVFSSVYGAEKADRLWSFSGSSDVLWWPWGVDHDAAEAPKETAALAAGEAEIRLITVANAAPGGDRCVDFVVLTTNQNDTYKGFKPYGVATPFAEEALAETKLYMRFRNGTGAAAKLSVTRAGHFQPQYGGATTTIPAEPVAAGTWSPWVNIGPFCRLVHDEGLWLKLKDASTIEVQVSRDAAGQVLVGDVKVPNGEAIVIPLEITWQPGARVIASRDHAAEIVKAAKTWRHANGGKKPRQILYFGDFRSQDPWVAALKDAVGYNTGLPDSYEHVSPDGLHAHAGDVASIQKFASGLKEKSKFLVLSFGDEISLGRINFKDPAMQEKFRGWLKAKRVTRDDLGMDPAQATLQSEGNARLVWYSNLFNEEERFGSFRDMTRVAREAIGPHVLTGANYSPHHLALCYGPVFQWVDIFKNNGMSMFWAEDYIFSVPEVPQMISWMFAEMRCAVKYNAQPIHFYVMPHAPGQMEEFLRRNMVFSVGAGVRHINNFWVAPAENFTENFIAWNYTNSFRAVCESIFDSAEVEGIQASGKLRAARVAVVIGKATDFNESRLMVDKAKDPFAGRSRNAPAQVNQIVCRKDQQMLYLALRHAGVSVDLITDDDIAELNALKGYDVVYVAGEWSDHRAVRKLDEWVRAGGVLYATAGAGGMNEFGEPAADMLKLLGLKDAKTEKNLYVFRTLLELPLATPIDTITMDGRAIPAVGMKQTLAPAGAKVLGTWKDGRAAVTVNELGKGKAFAVGTLAGASYMKTGLRAQPWARGGRKTVYNPTVFDEAATKLVRLGVDARDVVREVECSNPNVEALVMDSDRGTLVTLVNWDNAPIKDLKVTVKLAAKPKGVRSVQQQKALGGVAYENGAATFTTDLEWADYFVLGR